VVFNPKQAQEAYAAADQVRSEYVIQVKGKVVRRRPGTENATLPTGSALEQATKAALEYTGGGTVTETEVGDDGAAYGVEIRLDDGRQVEVNLDENFNVIGQENDDDGPNDQDGADDD